MEICQDLRSDLFKSRIRYAIYSVTYCMLNIIISPLKDLNVPKLVFHSATLLDDLCWSLIAIGNSTFFFKKKKNNDDDNNLR